jgi:hypothetical protein
MVFQGIFNAGTAYSVGSVVLSGTACYVCTSAYSAGVTPTYIGSTSSAASTTSHTVALPSGAQAGDYAIWATVQGDQYTMVLPTGFTQIVLKRPASTNYHNVQVSSKALTSGDITAGSITVAAQPTSMAGVLSVHRGVTGTGTVSSTTTNTSPAISGSVYAVFYAGAGYGDSVSDSPTGSGEVQVGLGAGSPQMLTGYNTVTSGNSPQHVMSYTNAAFTAQVLTLAFSLTVATIPNANFTLLSAS